MNLWKTRMRFQLHLYIKCKTENFQNGIPTKIAQMINIRSDVFFKKARRFHILKQARIYFLIGFPKII